MVTKRQIDAALELGKVENGLIQLSGEIERSPDIDAVKRNEWTSSLENSVEKITDIVSRLTAN